MENPCNTLYTYLPFDNFQKYFKMFHKFENDADEFIKLFPF